MDGFCRVANNKAPYTQYYQSDIPNYWTYAQKFGLADNMFSSLDGASFANHLYLAAATSNQFITIHSSMTGTDRITSRGGVMRRPMHSPIECQILIKATRRSVSSPALKLRRFLTFSTKRD